MEWDRSKHAKAGVDCLACHGADKDKDRLVGSSRRAHLDDRDAQGLRPVPCQGESEEFSRSHHALAGEILASLDNVLAEKAAGMPGNNADAVNGCLQCHGGVVKFKKDAKGELLREGPEGKPVLDPETWPNSGIGRINPTARAAPATPATPAMPLKPRPRARRRTAASATWAPTIRRSRSTTSPSTASPSTPTATRWRSTRTSGSSARTIPRRRPAPPATCPGT